MTVRNDRIFYSTDKDFLRIDLRPEGIDCIPLFGRSNFHSIREGTETHVHPGCTEICLCLKGNLRFESEGQEFPFTPGRVFVSNQDEPHRLVGAPKGLKLYSFLFKIPARGKRILGLTMEETRWIVHGLTHVPVRLFPASERVKKAFDRVYELYNEEDPKSIGYRLTMRTVVLELLLSLIEAPRLPAMKDSRPDPRISAVVERMRGNPRRSYPVDELAAEVGLSSVAFTEAFKRVVGLPPHAFLLSCRLEQARKELLDGNARVAQLAQRYGFSSPKHFATAFRKMFGLCPRQFTKGSK